MQMQIDAQIMARWRKNLLKGDLKGLLRDEALRDEIEAEIRGLKRSK